MALFDFLKEIPLSAVLQERLRGIEAEVSRLRSENARLIEQLAERDSKLAELQLARKLAEHATHSLDDEEVKILQALAAYQPLEEVANHAVAKQLSIGVQVASYHLESLSQRKLVDAHHYAGFPSAGIASATNWSLAHAGRGYLVKRGLLR